MKSACLLLVLTDPITANPDAGAAGVDLSGTDLTNKYCLATGQECVGEDLEKAKFATMPSQCLSRCSRNLSCMSAFIDANKRCHLRSARCDVTNLVAGSGDTYHRLKKLEKCPTGSEEYVEETKNYSNMYCMVADKACPGHNLYEKVQKLKPYMECLKKCSKIKACGMVDFHQEDKRSCEPMAFQCTDDELVDAPGTVNYIRLEEGVTTCSGIRVPAGEPETAPPAPPAPEPEPEPEPEGPTSACDTQQTVNTVCEHSTINLSCPNGKYLSVDEASYGRHDAGTCPSAAMHTTDCHAGNSLDKLREACQNKASCSLAASNSVFGDPCHGTYKYLTVKHRCCATPCGEEIVAPAVCEHKTSGTITCPAGQAIKIVYASYGRHDGTTCPGNTANRNCHAASSLQKVQEACENKSSCTYSASNGVFGDPCPGTNKYLDVTYRCCSLPCGDVQTNPVQCEHGGSPVSVSCPSGQFIKIEKASYGRHDTTTCPTSEVYTTNCHAGSSKQKAQEACDNKQSCSVAASNSVFGDPCVRTQKYLEISHRCCGAGAVQSSCDSAPVENRQVCEHQTVDVICPGGKTITVLSASYGREDAGTCPSASMLTTDCHATNSLTKVREICNGRTACRVDASNGVFGDPCFGTFKRLKVSYKCC